MKEDEFNELKHNLENYIPLLPESVIDHYMEKAGVVTSDPNMKKLVSLLAHKFITDVAISSRQYHKINQKAAQKDKRFANEKKTTFQLADLESALEEVGINISRPHYYI
ncbi:subunit of transcription initiation factor TFIID [Ordospora colligata]|uniref:Subunit of transcription initiation factor TFIID n=1 Tax=Ordospora colligata OC4 TaxID=1354746 RepID=A0A0B2UCU2_9MICR|nr:subunit of transcription initiation factor TFIID [Ordospora colligata OC4]KHN68851.1 subunit of transcription initiation factor TFIID [Ordospora colligata OC4]TBU13885.1 subunit of transcription initiation factor TFIID [Ordospora colligata]TBU14074.1 subunit of transcription initiation factor TFIID [Ordospora colligata]TBU17743.1 subunit of transcription initiation factor TFIID [Ordospora colligata]